MKAENTPMVMTQTLASLPVVDLRHVIDEINLDRRLQSYKQREQLRRKIYSLTYKKKK